jgi:hypothetical protein
VAGFKGSAITLLVSAIFFATYYYGFGSWQGSWWAVWFGEFFLQNAKFNYLIGLLGFSQAIRKLDGTEKPWIWPVRILSIVLVVNCIMWQVLNTLPKDEEEAINHTVMDVFSYAIFSVFTVITLTILLQALGVPRVAVIPKLLVLTGFGFTMMGIFASFIWNCYQHLSVSYVGWPLTYFWILVFFFFLTTGIMVLPTAALIMIVMVPGEDTGALEVVTAAPEGPDITQESYNQI